MLDVKFKKLNKLAKLPTKAHPSDACFDVWATEVQFTPEFIRYKLGFATAIPDGWEAKVYPRSSVSKKDLQLCNSVATIDCNYRGEWELRFNVVLPNDVIYNLGNPEMDKVMQAKYKGWKPRVYNILDEAIAQIQFRKVNEVSFTEVDELDATDRGEGGFGSSNNKSEQVEGTVNPETDGDGS